MKRYLNFLLILILLFIPSVKAKTVKHFYPKIGDEVEFKETVDGTSAIAGETVNSSGEVKGINFVAGNKISYTGDSEYLSVAGNYIDINGSVNNDTFIAGNIINIKENATLKRDVIIAGNDIEIKGTINRNITIYGAKVALKGSFINGNVRIYAEEITVDDNTIIYGKLSFPKDAKTSISPNIKNITKTDAIQTSDEDVLVEFLVNKVWSFMALIFVFAVLTLLVPNLFDKIQKKYKKMDFNLVTETFTKGLVFLIIVPVLSIVLLLLPFGAPLSLIMIALYFIAIYLSKIFAGYLIGYKLWQEYINSDINVLLVGLLGLVLLFLLDFVPVVRFISSVITLLFGIGIIIDMVNKKKATTK